MWSKSNKFYVKQYEAETTFRGSLVVDTSESMSYRGGAMSKYDYACTAAACLAYMIVKQQDSAALPGQMPRGGRAGGPPADNDAIKRLGDDAGFRPGHAGLRARCWQFVRTGLRVPRGSRCRPAAPCPGPAHV